MFEEGVPGVSRFLPMLFPQSAYRTAWKEAGQGLWLVDATLDPPTYRVVW